MAKNLKQYLNYDLKVLILDNFHQRILTNDTNINYIQYSFTLIDLQN